jgi:hypothetical protein
MSGETMAQNRKVDSASGKIGVVRHKHAHTGSEPAEKWKSELQELAWVEQESMAQSAMLMVTFGALTEKMVTHSKSILELLGLTKDHMDTMDSQWAHTVEVLAEVDLRQAQSPDEDDEEYRDKDGTDSTYSRAGGDAHDDEHFDMEGQGDVE